MSKLDDVLDEYFDDTGEGWDGNGKEAIKTLFIELVDKTEYKDENGWVISPDELRKEIKAL